MAKNFYTIIFTITVIIAIITLTFMAITMFLGREGAVWPPDVSECPDYWLANSDGSCTPQPSVGNIGSRPNPPPAPFTCTTFVPNDNNGGSYQNVLANKTDLTPSGPRCARQRWANACGVYWDGISDISPMWCASGTPSPGPGAAPTPCPSCPKCQ